ncbi:hypothetical protein SUVZ_06G0540 [Saccharomyces uvarum]|uniref:Nuclear pore protein n=1 Tax=Saccharomyces uvarum TaxID=230603 RepID=A0ABN8WSS5_SACUV|nr:hypothetical protein SUVZ_06G0540 [Saccharomyces uvarum]
MLGTLRGNQAHASTQKGANKKLNELLESCDNLPSASSELGSIQVSINELRRRVFQLKNKKKVTNDYTKAHYLLANSGLTFEDVDSFIKDLQTKQFLEQNAPKKIEGEELEFYLKTKKDENILMSIEQLLTGATKDFDNFINQNLNLDWSQHKDEVMKNFGILVQDKKTLDHRESISSLDPKLPSWGNKDNNILNSNESRLNVNENNILREKFENYARIVFQLNNSRQANGNYDIANEFISILSSANGSRNVQLLESWRILESMKSKDVNVVEVGKQYLEQQFLQYTNNLYKKNMNEGLATNINKIKSFIDTKLKKADKSWKISNLTVINGVPIWALIFYLLRAGLIKEALEVLVDNKANIKKVEQSFLTYFRAYASSKDHGLPVEYSAKLHTEYNQHIKSSLDGDPYRLAVYKLIGRCDLSRKNIPAVTLSIEDWLWMHLMLIKESDTDNDPIYERYCLEDFQNIVISYGPSRFSNYYLQTLLLSGLYGLAIDYTYTFSEMDAVHLAIGLASLKLFKIDSSTRLAKKTKRDIRFANILANYTKSFRYSDPRVAVEYLVLITLNERPSDIELCHEALRELVLETKEFAVLLGKVGRDGARIPGVIEERQPLLRVRDEREFLHTITEQAARRADEDGRIYDSILLYQLAEEYDIVITLVNSLLSDTLSASELDQPLIGPDDNSESNSVLLARRMASIYFDNVGISKQIHIRNKENCMLLLNISRIRELYIDRQWQETLSQMELLDLLPFTDELSARKKAQDFSSLDDNIVKNIPNLLIITLNCISNMVHTLNGSKYQTSTKGQQIDSLKNVGRQCMIYAGMIQYRMPRETYSTLINIDVSL